MAGLEQNITRAVSDFDAIAAAIETKGVRIPDMTPTKAYPKLIQQIGASPEWQRPGDRPPEPVFDEGEQALYFLFGVNATGPNDMAVNMTVTGGYKVDWGDGVIDTAASAATGQHLYDYDSLDITPDGRGYKLLYIKVYPANASASVTGINLNVRHSLRPTASGAVFIPQVFEIYVQAPNVTSLGFANVMNTKFFQLEAFCYAGTNKITNFSYFFNGSNDLKKMLIDTSSGTNFNYFMNNCYSFNQPLEISTGNVTNFGSFMNNCYSFNQPLKINTSKGTSFGNFLFGCYSFNQPLEIDTSNGTNFDYFMNSCYSFNQPLEIDTSKGISFNYFLNGCNSLDGLITVDLIKGKSTIDSLCYACNALKGLRLLNMGTVPTTLNISYSSLDVPALAALFGDLCDRTGLSQGTITITGCYGTARLANEQKAIATNKNWVIKT